MTAVMPASTGAMDERLLGRMMKWSFGVHFAAIALAFVVPREWIMGRDEKPVYMHVTFGGALGPQTTGMTPIGGRTVEQVVPPPKRPDPVLPTVTRPTPSTNNTVVKPPDPKPAQTQKPPAPGRATPPATGQQITQGNTRVETGATGEGAGLTTGGQGGVAAEVAPDFCCPEYVVMMKILIDRAWNKALPGRGTTTMRFAIERDGRITNITVETSSGDLNLDFEAKRAVSEVKLQPLPDAYTEKTLQVRLKFPYGG